MSTTCSEEEIIFLDWAFHIEHKIIPLKNSFQEWCQRPSGKKQENFPKSIPARSVTRLDGAWGKKQVWRSHVRTWGLSEANVLYWRSTSDIIGTIQHPHNDSAPGKFYPLAPLIMLLIPTGIFLQIHLLGLEWINIESSSAFCFPLILMQSMAWEQSITCLKFTHVNVTQKCIIHGIAS